MPWCTIVIYICISDKDGIRLYITRTCTYVQVGPRKHVSYVDHAFSAPTCERGQHALTVKNL